MVLSYSSMMDFVEEENQMLIAFIFAKPRYDIAFL